MKKVLLILMSSVLLLTLGAGAGIYAYIQYSETTVTAQSPQSSEKETILTIHNVMLQETSGKSALVSAPVSMKYNMKGETEHKKASWLSQIKEAAVKEKVKGHAVASVRYAMALHDFANPENWVYDFERQHLDIYVPEPTPMIDINLDPKSGTSAGNYTEVLGFIKLDLANPMTVQNTLHLSEEAGLEWLEDHPHKTAEARQKFEEDLLLLAERLRNTLQDKEVAKTVTLHYQ